MTVDSRLSSAAKVAAMVLLLGCAAFGLHAGELSRRSSPTRFSELPVVEQHAIRRMVEPPADRVSPYSTPMYYLMHQGFTYEGDLDLDPDRRTYGSQRGATGTDHGRFRLDRNRPEWQEVMIRDWVELGLTSTHLNVYPMDGELALSPSYLLALADFVRLSAAHGLGTGVRLDGLGGVEAWPLNPDNPDNRIDAYLKWVAEIATTLAGKVDYYVLGDELTIADGDDPDPRRWTGRKYVAYFRRVAAVLRRIDPAVKLSSFAASSGQWRSNLALLQAGLAEVSDGVAINQPDGDGAASLFAALARARPDRLLLSNGMGYCSSAAVRPRYPEGDPYAAYPDDEAHGAAIARAVFQWWDAGAVAAPYYITLRGWEIEGRYHPQWYGFFGFEDYVVDSHGNLTVRRYPGYYALQTVAHTFYDRPAFRSPGFPVVSDVPLVVLRAYEHPLDGGSELLVMAWSRQPMQTPLQTQIRIGTTRYRHPVQIDLFNRHRWLDVPARPVADGLRLDVEIGTDPVILRLVAREPGVAPSATPESLP